MDHGEVGEPFDSLEDFFLQCGGIFYGHMIGPEFLELPPHLNGEFHPVVENGDEAHILPFNLVMPHPAHPAYPQNIGQPWNPKSWMRPLSYIAGSFLFGR